MEVKTPVIKYRRNNSICPKEDIRMKTLLKEISRDKTSVIREMSSLFFVFNKMVENYRASKCNNGVVKSSNSSEQYDFFAHKFQSQTLKKIAEQAHSEPIQLGVDRDFELFWINVSLSTINRDSKVSRKLTLTQTQTAPLVE